jgi:hypothetical protein
MNIDLRTGKRGKAHGKAFRGLNKVPIADSAP